MHHLHEHRVPRLHRHTDARDLLLLLLLQMVLADRPVLAEVVPCLRITNIIFIIIIFYFTMNLLCRYSTSSDRFTVILAYCKVLHNQSDTDTLSTTYQCHGKACACTVWGCSCWYSCEAPAPNAHRRRRRRHRLVATAACRCSHGLP